MGQLVRAVVRGLGSKLRVSLASYSVVSTRWLPQPLHLDVAMPAHLLLRVHVHVLRALGMHPASDVRLM